MHAKQEWDRPKDRTLAMPLQNKKSPQDKRGERKDADGCYTGPFFSFISYEPLVNFDVEPACLILISN